MVIRGDSELKQQFDKAKLCGILLFQKWLDEHCKIKIKVSQQDVGDMLSRSRYWVKTNTPICCPETKPTPLNIKTKLRCGVPSKFSVQDIKSVTTATKNKRRKSLRKTSKSFNSKNVNNNKTMSYSTVRKLRIKKVCECFIE